MGVGLFIGLWVVVEKNGENSTVSTAFRNLGIFEHPPEKVKQK
jgi:hypothetical protein